MKTSSLSRLLSLFALASCLLATVPAARADSTPQGSSSLEGDASLAPGNGRTDKVDVKALREKYWAKGEENELRVVRNRTYSKAHKIELGGFVGFTSTNPFISVKNLGLTLGYHFDENWAIEALYIKDYVSNSSAQTTFQQQTLAEGNPHTADSNFPRYFLGGEVAYSPIYGKLSLLGKYIIYYDMHLLGGAGETNTEAGTYITPLAGIGQQIWMGRNWSLRLDYRATYYSETVLNKNIGPQFLTSVGTNNNVSSVVTLGVTYLFGI